MTNKRLGLILVAALLGACRSQPAANEAAEANNLVGPVENAASNAAASPGTAPVNAASEPVRPAPPVAGAPPPPAPAQPPANVPPQPEAPATKRPGAPPPQPRAEPDPHAGHDMGNRAGTQR